MEERIARFIAALRASGVRVSLAESQDAWQAITHTGIQDKTGFKLALQSTLIKDFESLESFDEMFSLYFGTDSPPMLNPQAGMSPEEQQMLQQAVDELASRIQQLIDWLLKGGRPSQAEMEQLARQAGMEDMQGNLSPYQARLYARRMQNLLGWQQLAPLLEQLWELLAEMGMDPSTLDELQAQVGQNQEALQQQINEFAGMRVRDQMAEEMRKRLPINNLMQRPFNMLNSQEMTALRDQVRRLATRLRSRASLRQKRGKNGRLDAKATIRANLKYGSVPFDIRTKQRRLKPKLVTFLDISTSMRPVAEFFLRLLYELQDQIQKTNSFVFIDHLEDVSEDLQTRQVDVAVHAILTKMPSGYYNTDLGYSLRQFEAEYLSTLDSRTTVLVLGDGRNNYNDPALETFKEIGRRARRVIWMTPEYPAQWGTGDSDMLEYQPLCDAILQVRNLEQLASAIDHILA